MKKILCSLSLLCLILILSCKKEKEQDQNQLQQYAEKVKIYAINIYAQEATLSFVLNFENNEVVSDFQIRKLNDSAWKSIPYTDKNNIPVANLLPKTKYESRVQLSQSGNKKYSTTVGFTTQSYDINYAKLFSPGSKLYDAGNSLFSIEGAHHTVYGNGFLNEASINVKLTAVDNLSDVHTYLATVLNDSVLTFDIPRDLVSNSPYLRTKVYSCMVGNIPLIGYSDYANKNYNSAGNFTVMNRDINIEKFTVSSSTCPIISFTGNLGTHQTESVCPAYVLGVSMLLSERKLIIRSGGTLLKEILLQPTGTSICDGDGLAPLDLIALSKAMLAYHEVTSFNIRSSMGTGSYTAQIKQKTQDGTILLSNEFPFNL